LLHFTSFDVLQSEALSSLCKIRDRSSGHRWKRLVEAGQFLSQSQQLGVLFIRAFLLESEDAEGPAYLLQLRKCVLFSLNLLPPTLDVSLQPYNFQVLASAQLPQLPHPLVLGRTHCLLQLQLQLFQLEVRSGRWEFTQVCASCQTAALVRNCSQLESFSGEQLRLWTSNCLRQHIDTMRDMKPLSTSW
jgi:hypothetical protein